MSAPRITDDAVEAAEREYETFGATMRDALAAALPLLAQPVVDREALDDVLLTHNIECTGPGEVTCRGCRDRGWMSWAAYRQHIADAVLALLNGGAS